MTLAAAFRLDIHTHCIHCEGHIYISTVDLSNIAFPKPTDRRIRILTSFTCIYDYIALNTKAAAAAVVVTELSLASAELRYHGQVQSQELAPGVRAYTHPDYYQTIVSGGSVEYLPGNYTRYGDVTELVMTSDDRFAIFGVGDEVLLQFDASTEKGLPAGRTRKYVVVIQNFYNNGRNPLANPAVEPLPSSSSSSSSNVTIPVGVAVNVAVNVGGGAGVVAAADTPMVQVAYRSTYNTRMQ